MPELPLPVVVKQRSISRTTHTKGRPFFGDHTFLGKTTGPKAIKSFCFVSYSQIKFLSEALVTNKTNIMNQTMFCFQKQWLS